MPLSRDAHLAFWQTLARELGRGAPLIPSLELAQRSLGETGPDRAATDLVHDLREGTSLSSTMAARPWAFSQCECALIRAGEGVGGLDLITQRILEGIQDGCFPLPDSPRPEEDRPVAYWRALGRLLTSNVSLPETLRLVALEVAGPRLAEATGSVRQALLEGRLMAAAMRNCRGAFPEEVCRVVEAAERNGDLAAQALRIAEATETGRLAFLVPGTLGGAEAGTEQDKAAAVAFVAQVISAGVEQRASDIHLDPTEDGRGRVRLRVDGMLRELDRPPERLYLHVVEELKESCHLPAGDSPAPQEGRLSLRIAGRPFDLRVGIAPTVTGDRVVLRILDRGEARFDLDRIEFLPDDLAAVRTLCRLPHGLLLANGPAGSGKTTLLYALLHEVDRDQRAVVTVEDPVEYSLDRAAQVQVDAKNGLTAAQAIQSVLRQDPDVLMVGALDDREVASLCVQAALSGHLVLTSLGANSSPGAIRRLLDMGIEPFLVNAALAAVVSQRLVRVLCPQCKQEAEPPLPSLSPEAVELVQRLGKGTFFAPKGCDACHGTGYRGRTALHELLIPTDRVRHAIAASADVESLRNAALAAGMRPLLACGIEKAARGITSLQEVCRVAPHGAND
jgi:type II secretory ATPase GspE/PulE/Tfp pilus assembly ATPase PilB-like protein